MLVLLWPAVLTAQAPTLAGNPNFLAIRAAISTLIFHQFPLSIWSLNLDSVLSSRQF
jgi:hypothetical protein